MGHHSSGCLPAEKSPTFASDRQDRGPTTLSGFRRRCAVTLSFRIEADGQNLLTRRDVVTDRQIRLLRNRDVIEPGKFFFRCGSTVAAAHKVPKEITNMKE